MIQRRAPTALTAINNHQIWLVLMLSIVLTRCNVFAVPTVGDLNTLPNMPRYDVNQQAYIHQVLLNELLNDVDAEALYTKLKKQQRQQSNYLTKWPGLRDLLLTVDYNDEIADADDADNGNALLNARFIDRLRKLGANALDEIEEARANNRPIISPPASAAFKDHGIKKNIQYMSPCHFKICNMGRKRNARLIDV